LAADQNFNEDIVKGLKRREPDLDIYRLREAGLERAVDPEVLEWASVEKRVLLTHDEQTLIRYAHERVAVGKYMPGVILVPADLHIGAAIEDILLISLCCSAEEMENQVKFVPISS
jgi:predicted nuclease of predicted toxin-antitoxin system